MDISGQTQREMPLLGEVASLHMAPLEFLSRATWVGVLRYCVQRSGFDDYEVADEIGISHGYMAKVLKGIGNLSGERLLSFQRVTRCAAPAQWQAWHLGGDMVMRDPAAARIAELEREIAQLRRIA